MDAPARARWAHAMGAATASGALLVATPALGPGVEVLLVLVASALTLDLVRREQRDPRSPAPILCGTAVVLLLAVAVPPRFSHDLWSYAMVGRILAVHHASPYLHAAGAFGSDRFLGLVGREWRTGTTPYGPLFVLHAALVALVGGSHVLLVRLAFQGTAAAAVAAAMWVCWRETRRTSALALIGLHPIVACSVVNGGHNDALVGLATLLAVVAIRHERFAVGGSFVATALLVKVTAGLALLPLAAWSYASHGRRAVRALLAPCVGAVALMYVTPGFLHSLRHADTTVISRTSIWNIPFRFLPRVLAGWPHLVPAQFVRLGLETILVVVVYATWRALRARDPASGVVAALSSWVALAAYVLPWYAIWSLPTAALRPRSRLATLVAVQSSLAMAAFLVPRPSLSAGGVVTDAVRLALPFVVLALFAWALAGASEPRARSSRGVGQPAPA